MAWSPGFPTPSVRSRLLTSADKYVLDIVPWDWDTVLLRVRLLVFVL